jgi:hypothetical protein
MIFLHWIIFWQSDYQVLTNMFYGNQALVAKSQLGLDKDVK